MNQSQRNAWNQHIDAAFATYLRALTNPRAMGDTPAKGGYKRSEIKRTLLDAQGDYVRDMHNYESGEG